MFAIFFRQTMRRLRLLLLSAILSSSPQKSFAKLDSLSPRWHVSNN